MGAESAGKRREGGCLGSEPMAYAYHRQTVYFYRSYKSSIIASSTGLQTNSILLSTSLNCSTIPVQY